MDNNCRFVFGSPECINAECRLCDRFKAEEKKLDKEVKEEVKISLSEEKEVREVLCSIEEMKDKLEEYGSQQIWLNIEKIGNWKGRVAYRQIFFEAGGTLKEQRT